MAASLGDMTVNKTGAWRNVEPHHVEQIPPCTLRCPAGNDVVMFVTLAAERRYEDAWRVLAATTPFPGTCGRVCPHPCEYECNRAEFGGRVNIHAIERFIGDLFRDHPPAMPKLPSTGKRVAVVGSGPAGLSCAYQLVLAGHQVTVFEAHPLPGGMLRVGIPDYRLPPAVLDGEIRRIADLGVDIRCRTRVGVDIPFNHLVRDFDAVFVAVGLTRSRPLGAKGDDGGGVVSGVEVLRRINLGEPDGLGERVLVVGGGNTAMDVARSLRRRGRQVTVMYRRTRAEMPAIPEEIDELLAEHIPLTFLATPVEVVHDGNGRLTGVNCIRMQLGKPDASGRRRPEPVPGSEFFVACDNVVTAIGEEADLSFLPDEIRVIAQGRITADDLGRTPQVGLFAGGDAADAAGTVTAAIGYGRKAAYAIDAYLTGKAPVPDAGLIPSLRHRTSHVVRFDEINTAYFPHLPRIEPAARPPEERVADFAEVRPGLTEEELLAEARRCFSCGTCPACDNCYIFCPDAAITPVHGDPHRLYVVDYDYCKGCGVCAAECPRACIVMKPVHS